MENNWHETVKKIYSSLDLDRKVVGIKLFKNQDEFNNEESLLPAKKMNYCLAVASASKGYSIKLEKSKFLCKSGSRVLGIDKTDLKNSNGENWSRLGLYCNSQISYSVREELSYVQDDIIGVTVKPIEAYETIPDVIICISNPYNIMRLVQGYAYYYGMPKNINMIGNQGVCLECTARPYVKQDINVSLLCIGTRHKTNWKDGELAIGIPKEQITNTIDGIYKTINIMESNHNKEQIIKKFDDEGIENPSIQFNYNYYTEC
ncbi:DUF169 domain-containing protein [Terrisporobacter petrolearius]|uniref:DUF169 domain-containing protein n=1 Tax=Terrisporobacter petrolearius TaxID=1460447 RepID=UPI003B00F468